jgi:peptidoglycan/LPS O-acetylase OafA/YrhL
MGGEVSSGANYLRPGLLLVIAVIAVILRGSVFSEGGSVGAWGVVIVFWLAVTGSIAVMVARDLQLREEGEKPPIIKWALALAALGAIIVGGAVDSEPSSTAANSVLLVCLMALACIGIRNRIRSRKQHRSARV